MTENRHPVLSLAQQCQLLKISRSSLYDKPAGESALNVSLMRTMGLVAFAPGPHSSRRNRSHEVHPYLLRDLAVTRDNQAWYTDVAYIPMAHEFLYLVAVMYWYNRHVY
jgi:hypothetical protein